MRLFNLLIVVGISVLLPSCEFNCSVGKKDEVKGNAKVKDGARIYNNIELTANGVRLDKAYLITEDGQRVPDDNFVDFNSTIKMFIQTDSGWVEENDKVHLGASEKIISERGTVLVEVEDLFEKYADGISVKDSKSIYLSAILKLKEGAPPTSCTVSFRVWDKNGEGVIEGSYKLYSK